MTKEMTTTDIDHINIGILVIGSLSILLITKSFQCFFSFAVASAIVTINFRILRRIIEGGFLQTTVKKKAIILALPLKFLALAAAVIVVLKYGDIQVWFFLFGLSTVFLAVIIQQMHTLINPVFKRRQKHA